MVQKLAIKTTLQMLLPLLNGPDSYFFIQLQGLKAFY